MLFVVDEVIGQVLSIMKAQSVPYTAVFTALGPSRVSILYARAHLQVGVARGTKTNHNLNMSVTTYIEVILILNRKWVIC